MLAEYKDGKGKIFVLYRECKSPLREIMKSAIAGCEIPVGSIPHEVWDDRSLRAYFIYFTYPMEVSNAQET